MAYLTNCTARAFFLRSFPILILIALYKPSSAVPLLHSSTPEINQAAAQCCAAGPSCTQEMVAASASVLCYSNRWMSAQNRWCRAAACAYCASKAGMGNSSICRTVPIERNCPIKATSPPSISPTPMPAPSPLVSTPTPQNPTSTSSTYADNAPSPVNQKPCVLRVAGNAALINSSKLSAPSHWARHPDGSITWRPNGGSGIDEPGSGRTCAKFTVRRPGQYYVTLLSSAPHRTDHNDAWVKLDSGVDLYRPTGQKWRTGGSDWYKAFQNEGDNKVADYILTVNFDGHQLISKTLEADRMYSVCLGGRSSLFRVYGIVLAWCGGGADCDRDGATIRAEMGEMDAARCGV